MLNLNNKNLYLASPRGFCAGVERAIKIVERALELHNNKVYVKHEIVHNTHVVSRLKESGAIFVNQIKDVPENENVIFSAHGVSKEVQIEAKNRKLKILDATCPLVTKVHLEAIKLYKKGFHIILIGHEGHPEIEGTKGQVPDENITLIQTLSDAKNFIPLSKMPLAWISQTTLSVDDTANIVSALKKRFPNILSPNKDDICYATSNRQMAVKDIAPLVELMIIVGSQNSSNSKRLVEVSQKAGCKNSDLIENVNFLNWSKIDQVKNIGLSSGASAPEVLINEIKYELNKRYEINEINNYKIKEDVYFKLPNGIE